MKKAILLAGLSLCALVAPGAQATPTDNLENNMTAFTVKIKVVVAGYSDRTLITLYSSASSTTPISCSGGFKISRSHPSHEQLYKAALAAMLSGRNVGVGYESIPSGANQGCWVKSIGFSSTAF